MTPFQSYIEPALHRAQIWRLAIGIVVVLVFWILGTAAVFFLSAVFLTSSGDGNGGILTSLDSIATGRLPESVLIMLATFSGIWVGLFLVTRFLHKRPFRTLFSPDRRLDARQLLKGLVFGAVFAGISMGIAVLLAGDLRPGLAVDRWLILFLPLVALVIVQATAEELIFRGYLAQQLAARFSYWPIWAVLPSFLFGLLHYAPHLPDGGGFYYVAVTTLAGLMFCALVWRSGSLWAAVGVHVTINVVNLSAIGMNSIISGTQLFVAEENALIPLMRVDLVITAAMLVFVLAPTGKIFEPSRAAPGPSESATSAP